MVRQLPENIKRQIIELWVNLHTFRDISHRTGASTGAVSNTIKRAKEEDTSLEELRALKERLDRLKLQPREVLRGANFYAQLDDQGMYSTVIPNLLSFTKRARTGERAWDLANAGLQMMQLESQTGLTYQALLQNFEPARNEYNQLAANIASMRSEYSTLQKELGDLHRLKGFYDRVTSFVTLDQLEGFLGSHQQLVNLGFTIKEANLVANELKKIGHTPSTASQQLSQLLMEGQNLTLAIEYKKRTLEDLTSQENEAMKRLQNIKNQTEALSQQSDSLKQKIDKDKRLYTTRKQEQNNELTRLSSEKDRLEEQNRQLQEAVDNSKKTEQRLKEVEERIIRDEDTHLLWRILETPRTLKVTSQYAFTTTLKFTVGLHHYLKNLKDPSWKIIKLTENLEQLNTELIDLVRDENQRNP